MATIDDVRMDLKRKLEVNEAYLELRRPLENTIAELKRRVKLLLHPEECITLPRLAELSLEVLFNRELLNKGGLVYSNSAPNVGGPDLPDADKIALSEYPLYGMILTEALQQLVTEYHLPSKKTIQVKRALCRALQGFSKPKEQGKELVQPAVDGQLPAMDIRVISGDPRERKRVKRSAAEMKRVGALESESVGNVEREQDEERIGAKEREQQDGDVA